ncbi:hypothetical protein EJ08DRAFT_651490 [Tothia fuscella]|uniref:CFEM domain-containing protein n=1 Tax=Tothia fuscella TaxID=1048955 RepID=A0A9P4TWR0_9PEZI|nr:hypothetical protein EJ08DRAFT_651490 [Tothia fuscella]
MDCKDLKPDCLCDRKNFFNGIEACSKEACGPEVRRLVLDWYYDVLCAAVLAKSSSSFLTDSSTVKLTPKSSKTTKTAGAISTTSTVTGTEKPTILSSSA